MAWSTLTHPGLIFPKPYRRLGVRVMARGKAIHISPEAEECAVIYECQAARHHNDATFRANFWHDWRKLVPTQYRSYDFTDFVISVDPSQCKEFMEERKKK